jgi:hypothetical protein
MLWVNLEVYTGTYLSTETINRPSQSCETIPLRFLLIWIKIHTTGTNYSIAAL